jgi:hypothetical protein
MTTPSEFPSRYERLDAAWNAFMEVVEECGYSISVEDARDSFDIDIWTGPSTRESSDFLYTIYSGKH